MRKITTPLLANLMTIGYRLTETICQIMPKEPAIKTYRIVQAGPNSQLGGVKAGLFNSLYHSWKLPIEARPLSEPSPTNVNAQIKIFHQSPALKVEVLCGPVCICMCFNYIFNFL